jgi:hypothetical protein
MTGSCQFVSIRQRLGSIMECILKMLNQ